MNWKAATGLAVAVVAVSWGAPLARLTAAAPLAVALWRMTLATGLILPYAAARGTLAVRPRHRPAAFLAGILLGLHFGLWIPSLWLTSVSASVVLVETAPLWVLLLTPRFLGERISPGNLASFLVALLGVVVIAGGDFRVSPTALVGDVMALGGAVCMAGYLIVGKRLRKEVPLAGYLTLVNGGAALTLVGGLLLLRVPPWPSRPIAWLPLLGMALGPTLTGHTLLNWALAHVQAYRVNLAVLFEPVLASIWAWVFLAEAPPLHVIPGGVLVLGALALEYLPRTARA